MTYYNQVWGTQQFLAFLEHLPPHLRSYANVRICRPLPHWAMDVRNSEIKFRYFKIDHPGHFALVVEVCTCRYFGSRDRVARKNLIKLVFAALQAFRSGTNFSCDIRKLEYSTAPIVRLCGVQAGSSVDPADTWKLDRFYITVIHYSTGTNFSCDIRIQYRTYSSSLLQVRVCPVVAVSLQSTPMA